MSAQDFIRKYQQGNSVSGGISPLYDALQQEGYKNVGRYMYGQRPSDNELSVDGQKYKVLSGENTPGAAWYTAGTNDGGGYGSGGSQFGNRASSLKTRRPISLHSSRPSGAN